jgi:hypothetical protein
VSEDLKTQAKQWIDQVEKDRNSATLALGKAAKSWPSTKAILTAEPALKVAFVAEVVAIYGTLGVRTGKISSVTAWFHDQNVPSGAEEVARLLLRKRLPFSDGTLAWMFEQIAGMEFVTFAPVLQPLVSELEKRADEKPLTSPIRKALSRVADGLLVKHWKQVDAENWRLPRAADRKLAARIERLLSGPLDLN